MKIKMLVIIAVICAVIAFGLSACGSSPDSGSAAVSAESENLVIRSFESYWDGGGPPWFYRYINPDQANHGTETFEDGTTAMFFEHLQQVCDFDGHGNYQLRFFIPGTSLRGKTGFSFDIAATNMDLVNKIGVFSLLLNAAPEYAGYHMNDQFFDAREKMTDDPLTFVNVTFPFSVEDSVPGWTTVENPARPTIRVGIIRFEIRTYGIDDTEGRLYVRNLRFY